MFSAFGIEHGEIFSKMGPDQSDVHSNRPIGTVNNYVKSINTGNKRVPKSAYPLLHASVVRAYDDSRAHKVRAATKQATAGAVGGGVGSLVGLTAVSLAGKRIPGLKTSSKIAGRTLTSERKIGLAAGIGAGAVGGTSGAASNYYALQHTKKTKKYKFRRNSD